MDVKYTDRIHGFQGRLLKVVTKAQLKVELEPSETKMTITWVEIDLDCQAPGLGCHFVGGVRSGRMKGL